MKKILSMLLALAMLASLAACGGTTSESSSSSAPDSGTSESSSASQSDADSSEPVAAEHILPEEEVVLKVGLHHFRWSPNEEPTEEAPNVFNSTRYISQAYSEMYPNVSFEPYDMTFNTPTDLIEVLTVLVAGGSAADIFFSWGNSLENFDWYYNLNDAILSPNWYEPSTPVWKEMYPEYLWDGTYNCTNIDGDVLSIPVCFNAPGTAGLFVNTDLFAELGLALPATYQEMVNNTLAFREAGYVGYVPSSFAAPSDLGSWDWWAFLTPSLSAGYDVLVDTDGDGTASREEYLLSYLRGEHYIQNNRAVQNLFRVFKYNHTVNMEEGAEAIDYGSAWMEGRVAVLQDGLWRLAGEASNTSRPFDYQVVLHPYVSTDTRFEQDGKTIELTEEDILKLHWTDNGPDKLDALECSYNVFDPAAQDRSQANADYAIDFLKYLTSTENLSMIIEENGSFIGATKSCPVPPLLVDWMNQSFPSKPVATIFYGNWTAGSATTRVAILQQYVQSMITEEEFFRQYDAESYRDVMQYVEEQEFDISDLDVYVPEGAEA